MHHKISFTFITFVRGLYNVTFYMYPVTCFINDDMRHKNNRNIYIYIYIYIYLSLYIMIGHNDKLYSLVPIQQYACGNERP